MRRHIKAWLSMLLVGGMCIAGVIAVLLPHAPRSSRPIALVHLSAPGQSLTLPGRLLTCSDPPPAGSVADCSLVLEENTLSLSVQGSSNALGACAAEYRNQLHPCVASFGYAPRPAPSIIVHDTLDLSAAQFEALRESYALNQYSEADWGRITLGLTALLGLVALAIGWLCVDPQTSRARTAVLGNAVAQVSIVVLALQLSWISLGFID